MKNNIIKTTGILLILSLAYFIGQWGNRPLYPPEINAVLSMAGKNRTELENVLKHYSRNPADSLKLRAAEFLIVNMPGKYSEYYDAPWNDVATVYLRWTSSSNKQLVLDTYALGELVIREDVKYITAEYLINNIELSFKVWQERPWGKYIPFDAFCEDILPYRINTEPLENWREKVLASFADLNTVLNEPAMTAVEACSKINNLLPRFRLDKDFPSMNYTQLMASTRAMCDNMSALGIFSMRGLGIPVTFESTPRWVHLPSGHTWNAVRDSAGNYISFMGTESNPYNPHQGNTLLKSKVYRKTFALQQKIFTDNKNIPPLLRNLENEKDVSAEYEDCTDTVTVHLRYPPEISTGYVYLASEHEYQLYPVAWAVDSCQTALFPSIGKNVLYFPVYYAENELTPAGDPFWLDAESNTLVLSPDSPDTLLIFSEIAPDEYNYLSMIVSRMQYGVFEGANKSDFSDAKILFKIKTVPGIFYNEVVLKTPANYQYLRYKSPPGGFCNVAEIEFYSQEEGKLYGTHIGTPGAWNNSKKTGNKAFDNDVTTYYDAHAAGNTWTGLDLHEKKKIHKIRFFPRTDNYNIYEGHHYELFYRTKDGWTLLDKQTATGNTLQWHVPSRALMYLYNATLDKKGKIFFLTSDNKIHWQ
jgi:hypothetical protein